MAGSADCRYMEIDDSNTTQLSWKSTNNMVSKVIFGHQHDCLSERQTCEVRSVALEKQPYTLHNQLKHLQQRKKKKGCAGVERCK